MSDNPDEAVYYLRFIAMFIDLATETVLKVFYTLTPKTEVKAFLTKPEIENTLKCLKRKKILSSKECRLIFSPNPHTDHFDISLLITLLTNLYSGKLAAPKSGWTSAPDPGDLSISADLVRLQGIRNTIIAHQPQAKLFKVKFEYLWYRVEDILVRLVQQVDLKSETAFKEKIATYKVRPLDQQNEKVRIHLEKLREWWDNCEEISKLQEKVEDLVKKTQDLVIFFKTKPERYTRYIKLLFDGGRFVLRGVLNDAVAKGCQTLEAILLSNKNLLKEKFVEEEMFEKLFVEREGETVTNTDIDTWDIAVLAAVVINIFPLDDVVAANVTTIMEARIQYADNALVALDSGRFSVCCEDLISSVRVLSSRLGKVTYDKCNEVIAEYRGLSDRPVGDAELYLEELKCHGSHIKTIAEVYKETLTTLKKSVQKMEDEGVVFKHEHALELKIVTLGDNKQKVEVAEDTLETVWKAALNMSDDPTKFEAVRKALDKILDDIRKIPDVKADDIVRHCILLRLKCYSWPGLLHVIEYIESSDFQQHLQNIAGELEFIYEDYLHVVGNLTTECILNVLNNPESTPPEPEPFLRLPIQCRSAEGMRNVLEVLGSDSTINRFNEIADSLSAQVGDKVTLSIKPDVNGFSGIFEESADLNLNTTAAYNENIVLCKPLPGNSLSNQPSDEIIVQKPWIEIVEQPRARGLRFSESPGSIRGENSTSEMKTFPSVKIHNYTGPAVIVVSCVTKDDTYRPHPHNLVGKDCKKGVCTLRVRDISTVSFPHLGIQCSKKKDIEENLRMRQDINVDPFQTGFKHKSPVDLNVVRLCFQVFLPDDQGKISRAVPPVVSQAIYDKKALNDLVISRVDRTFGKASGEDEVFLLSSKINGGDIRVLFSEVKHGQVTWVGFGTFGLNDIHRQFAIVLKTPPYHEKHIKQPVGVQMQIQRLSDMECSDPIIFVYMPENPHPNILEKRKRTTGSLNFMSSLVYPKLSTTVASHVSEPPSKPMMGNSLSSQLSHGTIVQGPWIEIVEQPRTHGLRFSESPGSIRGENSTLEMKTFPSIKIHNYTGPAIIVVSCVTKDDIYRPHPHNLVGNDCKKGVCTLRVRDISTVSFPHLGIQYSKKKDIEGNLRMRQDINVDPFQTGFSHKTQKLDLNVVRLCFQVFLPDDQGKITRVVPPVVSHVLHIKNVSDDLVLSRVNRTSGKPQGGDEIFLLCSKINRDDICVRFFEEGVSRVVWEGFGEFGRNDIHCRVAIVFKTPPYHNQCITQPVQVQMQIQRPSDRESSNPVTFTYMPGDPHPGAYLEKPMNTAGLGPAAYFEERIISPSPLLLTGPDKILEKRRETASLDPYLNLEKRRKTASPDPDIILE